MLNGQFYLLEIENTDQLLLGDDVGSEQLKSMWTVLHGNSHISVMRNGSGEFMFPAAIDK